VASRQVARPPDADDVGVDYQEWTNSCHGPWLLYDNQADPYQKQNLVGKGRYRDLQARLERMLDKKLKAAGDDFLPVPVMSNAQTRSTTAR
jgi:hypothetical protein